MPVTAAIERQVTVVEAFLLYLRREAAKNGGGPASRAYGALIKQDADRRPNGPRLDTIMLCGGDNLLLILEPLRMARTLDRCRDSARRVIEPWPSAPALGGLCRTFLPPR